MILVKLYVIFPIISQLFFIESGVTNTYFKQAQQVLGVFFQNMIYFILFSFYS